MKKKNKFQENSYIYVLGLVQLFPSKHEGQKEKWHENSNPLAIQRHFSLGLLKYKIQIFEIYKYTDVHAYILSAHANIQA